MAGQSRLEQLDTDDLARLAGAIDVLEALVALEPPVDELSPSRSAARYEEALPRRARDTLRSLQVRNFRLFFGGQLISQIGNWLTLVAQALLVLHLTDNNGVAVGVLTACQFLPVLVLGAWAGLVADRSDKRKLLMIVQSFAMLQSFVLAALAFTGDPPLLAVYAVAMLGGIATAFDNPARRAFVTEMVPESHVQNAVSLNSALMTGSRIVGPALAGLLIVTVGYGWCFAVDGISYVAVLYGLWRMNPDRAARARCRRHVRRDRCAPACAMPARCPTCGCRWS